MAGGNFTCPLVTVANGDIIDATVRNDEFVNILASANPTGLSGFQDNLAQKQLQEDPATGLVTSLGKELEQLRFALKRILGETYWYTAPDTDLSLALFSGKAGDVVLGDGTKTTTDPLLTLNADTGDAGLRLQVNNTSDNAWDIFNQNSANDSLNFRFNGDLRMRLQSGVTDSDLIVYSRAAATDAHYFIVHNKNTADATDAGIILRVNDNSANDWTLYTNNSANDRLSFNYNGVNKFYLRPDNDDIVFSGASSPSLHIINTTVDAAEDVALILRVNDNSANQWRLVVDNSDNDNLKLQYASTTTRFQFIAGGTVVTNFNCVNLAKSSNPIANTLYPHTMVKAWGNIVGNNTTTPTISDAFNVNTAVISSDRCTVTFRTAMADTNYAVVMTSNVFVDLFGALVVHSPFVYSKATTGFVFLIAQQAQVGPTISKHDIDGANNWSCNFMVVGRQ